MGYAPRFGAAYDVTGQQKIVVRGGGGLFFDRPSGNSVFDQILNPPTQQNVTVRYGELQSLGSGGLATTTPPALSVYEVDAAAPVVVPVELRRADVVAVGDRARRLVRRPARLQHRAAGQPQRGGLRRGVPGRRTRTAR